MESRFEEFAGLAESPHGQAAKRLLLAGSPDGDAVGKKRRKQSRPIRIPSPSDQEQPPPPPLDEVATGARTPSPPPSAPHLETTPPPHAPPPTYPYGLLPSLLQFSPHFLLPMLPSAATSPATPISQSAASTSSTSSAATPSRIFNLEAYCELCSKEFCNKYFLKTHKANRHGIYVKGGDTPPSSNTPTGDPSKIMLQQQQPQQHQHQQAGCVTPESLVKFPCDACPKKFGSEYTLKRHKAKTHLMTSSTPMSALSLALAPLEGLSVVMEREREREREMERPGSVPPPHQQPSEAAETPATEASPLSPGRLRRLGVINADAFCEICSKEYCNKYFLKTHKLKRHGIRDPEDPLPKGWPLLQTSPLNLTVSELANGGAATDQNHLHQEDEGLLAAYLQPKEEPEEARDLSEDLQKLQTMLLQLNALNGAAAGATDAAVFAPQAEQNGQGTATSPTRAESAPLDGGVERREPSPATYAERPESMLEVVIKQEAAEEQPEQQPEAPPPPTQAQQPEDLMDTSGAASISANFLSSTSCYCDICNKELCNKYFKKVHMQKMHGIEIKDNALSGGVPCDICHKQLCSKYFVRVHKQNTHGIVDLSAPPLPGSPQVSAASSSGGNGGVTPPPSAMDASALKPLDGADLNHRYFTHFNVVCPLCSRRFRSAKWLRAHLVNDHAEQGIELAREIDPRPTLAPAQMADAEDQRSYHCSYCSFATPVLSLLFVHERSHAGLRPPAPPQHHHHQQQQQQPEQPKAKSQSADEMGGVWQSLREAARESQVPATYAVPQAPPDKFIMQPFLLEEPPDGTFVPSLVFLPVREKVSGQLTVSFTLTPA